MKTRLDAVNMEKKKNVNFMQSCYHPHEFNSRVVKQSPKVKRRLGNHVCILVMLLGLSALLSGCGLALLAVDTAKSIPSRCRDFHLNDFLSYSHDFEEDVPGKDLVGIDAAFYVARAKIQDLDKVYDRLITRCQENFSSQLDLCKGYALKYVLVKRSVAYHFDLDPNVYPLDDVEYQTAKFQAYYDALSDSTKKKIEDPESYDSPTYFAELGRVLTAAEAKASKIQFVNEKRQDFYHNSAPIGVSDPSLEPAVIAYIQNLNPELTVQSVVFDENWIVNKHWNEAEKRHDEIYNKSRVAAITVKIPNRTETYVLNMLVNIQMDYEGGGSYGEAHGVSLIAKNPLDHRYDLLSKKEYSKRPHYNSTIEYGEISYTRPHILYENRWRLYDYDDYSIFTPLQQ